MLQEIKQFVGGTWIVAPHGRGGRKIIELNKGTEPYENGLVMARAAADAATSLNKTLDLPFFTFIQGESDVGGDAEVYKSELVAYYADMVADYSIVGDSVPSMFITQIGTSGT
eukprot:UN26190